MEAINRFGELFLEVWKEGVFGLNASEIIIGIVIFLIFYVLRRLFARFIISRLNKIVNKTSTKIDNTVVEVIEGPLKFLPVVLGFFIATSYINLSTEVQDFIDLLNRTLITIFIFSSTTGYTQTLAKLVCLLAPESKGDILTNLCIPDSFLSHPKT